VKVNRLDETLNLLKHVIPVDWDAERDVASHMFSEIQTDRKRKD
jgi:hypothetical protein